MSYILDALRKAERERSLGQVPTIDTVGTVPAQEPRRLWPWLLGAALLVNAAVLAAWLFQQKPAAPMPVPALAQPAEPEPLPPAPPPAVADYLPPPTTVIEEPISEAPVARAPILSSSPPVTREPGGSSTAVDDEDQYIETEPPPQPAAVVEETPVAEDVPQLRDMPADYRRNLPAMKVDAHFYTTVPGRSFVMINLVKYKTGERLSEGPQVDEIVADGVILSYQGRRFLLTP